MLIHWHAPIGMHADVEPGYARECHSAVCQQVEGAQRRIDRADTSLKQVFSDSVQWAKECLLQKALDDILYAN